MTNSPVSKRNSVFIALAIAVAFAGWMLSGLGGSESETGSVTRNEGRAMRVTVRNSVASTIIREIDASARTEPNRGIDLKAETEGMVVAIGAERGAYVTAGQTIARLDIRDRKSLLTEAEALIRQRELEFEAARRLRDQNFMSEAEFAGAEALLVSAQANRDRIALDIARTDIKAPFDAVVFDRMVEIGDYIGTGDEIAQLVDVDPLIIVGNINERDVGVLSVGNRGIARVLGGPEIEGVVRYLAPVADESTRSFRIELAVPNPDRRLAVGASAELVLGADEVTAHALAESLLALSDDGTVGVKTVDDSNRVRFMPIELEGSAEGVLLVSGLPREATIITVGQGFVAEGQTVIPVEEATALTQADDERAY